MTNKYKELGCQFKNEDECQEEIEEEGEDLDKVERDFFEEND